MVIYTYQSQVKQTQDTSENYTSLYMAKSKPRNMGSSSRQTTRRIGFKNLQYDQRIYFYQQRRGLIMKSILLNDLPFSSNSHKRLQKFKAKRNTTFDARLLRKLLSFNCWNRTQTNDGTRIDQTGYESKANISKIPLLTDADVLL